MEIFGPGDQPLLLRDSILAFALHLAFVPFGDDEMPCVNHYTPDQLRELGYTGMLPQAAALQAVKDGNKGTVEYMFKQPDSDLVTAFEDQKKVIQASEGEFRDVVKNLIEDYKNGARSYEEMIIRLACTMVFMRAEFISMWKAIEPWIQYVDTTTNTEDLPDGSRVVSVGGFKFVGANAGKKTLERLGLC